MSKKKKNRQETVAIPENKQIEASNYVIQSACGMSKGGFPNATSTMCLFQINEDNTVEQIKAIQLEGPSLEILGRGQFIEVRMQYASMRSHELREIEEVLFTYQNSIDDLENGVIDRPLILTMLIVPIKFEAEMFIQAINPILWAEQNTYNGKPDAEMRLIFQEENFDVLSANGQINIDEIKQEVERELEQEEAAMQKEYESLLAQLDEKEDVHETFTDGYTQYDIDRMQREIDGDEQEEPEFPSRIHREEE